MMHAVKDLSAEQRHVLEALVGRALREWESLEVSVAPVVKSAPPPEKRLELARKFHEMTLRIDEQCKDVPQEELEEAYDEAIRHVRAKARSIR